MYDKNDYKLSVDEFRKYLEKYKTKDMVRLVTEYAVFSVIPLVVLYEFVIDFNRSLEEVVKAEENLLRLRKFYNIKY